MLALKGGAQLYKVENFGDYGICGFYALDKTRHQLKLFLFSCRILNLGVENYVYGKLACPQIEIKGDVSSALSPNEVVDWITETGDEEIKETSEAPANKKKILFLGGCDLEQLCHYIKQKNEYITDFNFPNTRNVAVHKEHTAFLRDSLLMSEQEKKDAEMLPLGDSRMFDSKIFSDTQYDVLVYSVLMNYTHEVYVNSKGHRIAYGGYMNEEGLMEYLNFSDDERNHFTQEYRYLGLQTPESFKDDLEWLVKHVKKPIVFINGAEVDGVSEQEPGAYNRHVLMNKAFEEFVSIHKDQCSIIDVRDYAKDVSGFRDTIRHYKRTVYVKMSEQLLAVLDSNYQKK